MSGEGGYDLTGEWTGIYNYPRMFPPNMFEASIRDSGGVITGIVRQPGEFFEPTGTHHQAVIEGVRVANLVRWVKVYDDLARATPHYEGTIQPDGNEIEGTWHIPGDWSGTFLMVRRGKEEAAETRQVSEEVGAR